MDSKIPSRNLQSVAGGNVPETSTQVIPEAIAAAAVEQQRSRIQSVKLRQDILKENNGQK